MNPTKESRLNDAGRFLTLPEEELLIAQRKHWFTLAVPLLFQSWLFLISLVISYLLLITLLNNILLFLLVTSSMFVFFLTSFTKTIIDWYFHFYVITNNKIVEVACTPLFSHSINEILLDQVRCTEIDIKQEGILNHILNRGDIVVTFDRPTHQEEFWISDVANPHMMGTSIADAFDQMGSVSQGRFIQIRKSNGQKKGYIIDDIYSDHTKGGKTDGISYPRLF